METLGQPCTYPKPEALNPIPKASKPTSLADNASPSASIGTVSSDATAAILATLAKGSETPQLGSIVDPNDPLKMLKVQGLGGRPPPQLPWP